MKLIATILLTTILSFSAYSQIDSIKGKLKISNMTNIFKKKSKSSIQGALSKSLSTTDTSKVNSTSVVDTSSKNQLKIKKDTLITKKDTLVKKVDSTYLAQSEFIRKMSPITDTSHKAINIFIVGGSNIDVNVSSGGILTVNKTPPGFSQQLFNNMLLANEPKKKGFLSDMDSAKLTSLITLVLASLPIIISSFK